MIHNLTAGHFDQGGAVARPLDLQIVRRLLVELGDPNGALGGWKVRYENGCVILPWKGGSTNRVAEEFAIRLQRATGSRWRTWSTGAFIEPTELAGLKGTLVPGGARK